MMVQSSESDPEKNYTSLRSSRINYFKNNKQNISSHIEFVILQNS